MFKLTLDQTEEPRKLGKSVKAKVIETGLRPLRQADRWQTTNVLQCLSVLRNAYFYAIFHEEYRRFC